MYFTMNTYDNIPRTKNVAHWLVETKLTFNTIHFEGQGGTRGPTMYPLWIAQRDLDFHESNLIYTML